jgi:glycerol-3-phosphate cytidylyltransferase
MKLIRFILDGLKRARGLCDDLTAAILEDELREWGEAQTCVLTYGTFDLFHFGHLEILRRAKELGSCLIVGVSTDEFNLEKNKKCVHSFSHRSKVVSSIKYVDRVIPEESWSQKQKDITKYGAKILVMGDDWKGKFNDIKNCRPVYLPRTPEISSTEIKIKCCEASSYLEKDLIN